MGRGEHKILRLPTGAFLFLSVSERARKYTHADDIERRLSEVMALQVASLFGVLRMDDTDFRSGVKNAKDEMKGLGERMQNLGGSISSLGGSLTGLTAPAAAAFGVAAKQAIDFDSSIHNIGAVLGLTKDQMADLNSQLLEIGGSRRAGPQAVAESFYDIVGGVADASTHMAILNAALDTAEAGGANLKATTSGLISVMNSYGFSADKASHVSDIFTRVVGVGVGSMDEFVSALGPVAGLAASTGVSFEELGTSAAFLTTKGFSATQASTRLQSAITALIKPNQDMADALKAAGLASGSAALKQYGLVGTLQRVSNAVGGSTDAMAAALGTTEALGATTALLGQDFKGFSDNFAAGLDGATAAAKSIQNLSAQAQLELLNSQMSELSISVGNALVPALLQVVNAVKPVISDIIDWVKANPELVAQIGMIVGVLAVAGPILIGVGAAISAIGVIIGVVLSPIGLIVAAVAGLALAWQNNFGGIRDTLQPIVDTITKAFGGFFKAIQAGVPIGDAIRVLLFNLFPAPVAAQIISAFSTIGDFITGTVLPVLGNLANWFINDALPAIVNFVTGTVIPAIGTFFDFLGQAWAVVGPALASIADWFINTALPAIVGFVTGTVVPAIGGFLQSVADFVVNVALPALLQFGDWFLNTALPAIVGFVTGTVIPAIGTFFDFLGQAWAVIGPALGQLADWFINTALPAIVSFIQTTVIPGVQGFIDLLVGIWTTIQPGLSDLWTWFTVEALPAVVDFITNTVMPAVQDFIDILVGIWTTIQPGLSDLWTWFTVEALPAVVDFITNTVMPAVQDFIDILVGIWTVIQPGLDDLKTGISNIFNWIKDNIIQPVIDRITEFINTISGIGDTVSGITGGVGDFFNNVGNLIAGPGTILGGVGTTIGQLRDIGAATLGQGVVPLPPPTSGGFLPSGDYQGVHPAGAYVVGTGAQPQLFMPTQDMYGIPNIDQRMGGGDGGITFNGPVYITANNPEEFGQQIRNKYKGRGN